MNTYESGTITRVLTKGSLSEGVILLTREV